MASRSQFVIVAAVALACVGGALACGPDFYWQLLDDRVASVVESPAGLSFASQATKLVRPSDDLRAVEEFDRDTEAREVERREAQSGVWQTLLTRPLSRGEALVKFEAARGAMDDEEALAAGAGLPAAIVEYIAGARAFLTNRPERALVHFEAIDRLPPEQRRLREVAAAYMQGRTHLRLGNLSAAQTAFRLARARALEGAPDPLGLGVASFGEEARINLMLAPATDASAGATLYADAVRLYAEQAARGSAMALWSLREVASRLTGDGELLRRAIADPLVRRLVVAYVIAADDQSEADDASNGTRDAAAETVIDAVLAQPDPPGGDDVDRLAVLAYQTGRYDQAERLTAATDRALGLWVRAKLAFRRGDMDAARRDLERGVAAMGNGLDPPAGARLQAELAVMRLAEGRYADALRFLLVSGRFWGDAAYVAERVLSIDELKSFVDGLPPVPQMPADTYYEPSPGERLRFLLARRMARQGRTAEAISYFPEHLPVWFAGHNQVGLRQMATAYHAAVENSQPTWRWRSVSRAEALFELAVMTRWQNRELLATEGPPDGFEGIGQPEPRGRASDDELLGPDEGRRFAAADPKPGEEVAYRVLAARHAFEAAELLPRGSQAYAATLCWASRDAKLSGDPEWAWRIYRHYAATGAYQPWAKSFGGTCPQPDFEAARDYWPKRIVRLAQRHTALAAGAGLVLVLVIAGSIVALRRRRAE